YLLDRERLDAPLDANERVGEIELYNGDTIIARMPLVALEKVKKGGVFSRFGDWLHLTL
ncbi:serine-type D-Ala-D-Ala carboxypeptidase, partial [Cronobacter sakazakii]